MRRADKASLLFCLEPTPFGPLAIVWSVDDCGPKIHRIIIPAPAAGANRQIAILYPNAAQGSCREIRDLSDRLDAYFSGEPVEFPLDNINLDLCPPFYRKVLPEVYAIPGGKASSYGDIAERLASPKAARAVGTAMATNPFPIVIPCHRVIRSDRSLGGYGGGAKMKRRLLEMEGVEFTVRDRVAESCLY
jgi:methylated-DNA-[protein]-cysteine S-methyltransferase